MFYIQKGPPVNYRGSVILIIYEEMTGHNNKGYLFYKISQQSSSKQFFFSPIFTTLKLKYWCFRLPGYIQLYPIMFQTGAKREICLKLAPPCTPGSQMHPHPISLIARPGGLYDRLFTVPKEIDFPRYNRKYIAGKTSYNAEYFMQYHVFHYI